MVVATKWLLSATMIVIVVVVVGLLEANISLSSVVIIIPLKVEIALIKLDERIR